MRTLPGVEHCNRWGGHCDLPRDSKLRIPESDTRDDNALYQFNKNNKQKIRAVGRNTPVKLQPFSMAVDRNQMVLKDFIDNAIHDLINDGTMDRLLRKWEPEPGKTYLRVANPAKVQ